MMSAKPSFNKQRFPSQQAIKTRCCLAYNQGANCKVTSCPFTHICQICEGRTASLTQM